MQSFSCSTVLFLLVVTRIDSILFTSGCNLIMGHAVDKDLLCLVQDEVKDLIKEYSAFKAKLNLQNKQVEELEEDFSILKDQEGRLNEHHERLDALEEKLKEASENTSEEITKILESLVSFEEHSRMWLQALEERVYRLEQSHTETTVKVEVVGLELKSLKTQIDKPGKLSSRSVLLLLSKIVNERISRL